MFGYETTKHNKNKKKPKSKQNDIFSLYCLAILWFSSFFFVYLFIQKSCRRWQTEMTSNSWWMKKKKKKYRSNKMIGACAGISLHFLCFPWIQFRWLFIVNKKKKYKNFVYKENTKMISHEKNWIHFSTSLKFDQPKKFYSQATPNSKHKHWLKP